MKEPRAAAGNPAAPQVLSELRVSGHLMLLEPGLFCVVQTPTAGADAATGLPGVRLSQAPNAPSDAVQISGFASDGWLSGRGDAALVRVIGQPAQILVTIYQSPEAREGAAPNLQVLRMLDANGAMAARPAPLGKPAAAQAGSPLPVGAAAPGSAGAAPKVVEMVAHIQSRGDVGAMIGEWLGERGSGRWIEGFAVAPSSGVASKDIEYQAVLGQGWLSPWVEGGQFCGSRAMALPVLGLRVRLRGEAAATHRLQYSATFIDGTEIGPVGDGEACEAADLAAMESFRIDVRPRAAAPRAAAKRSEAAPRAAAKPGEAAPRRDTTSRQVAPKPAPSKAAPAPAAGKLTPPGNAAKPAARPVAEPARRAKPSVPPLQTRGKGRR